MSKHLYDILEKEGFDHLVKNNFIPREFIVRNADRINWFSLINNQGVDPYLIDRFGGEMKLKGVSLERMEIHHTVLGVLKQGFGLEIGDCHFSRVDGFISHFDLSIKTRVMMSVYVDFNSTRIGLHNQDSALYKSIHIDSNLQQEGVANHVKGIATFFNSVLDLMIYRNSLDREMRKSIK